MTEPAAPAANAVLTGLSRGVRRRCPACGEGRLFRGYLKVQETCANCGHDNGQYPADDAGPYFTVLLVGHLVIGPMLFFPFIWKANIWLVLAATLIPIAVATLVALPFVKGAVVGVWWGLKSREAAARDGGRERGSL